MFNYSVFSRRCDTYVCAGVKSKSILRLTVAASYPLYVTENTVTY